MYKTTLKRKIISFFLLIGPLPLVIIVSLAFTQIPRSLENTAGDYLLSLARGAIAPTEELFQNVFAQFGLLTANPLVKSKEATPGMKLEEIKKIQDFFKTFEDITLVDLDGNTIASTHYAFRGEWENKEWYQEARQGKMSVSPAHRIVHPMKTVVVFTAPIKDENEKIVAVIAGQLNMEKLREITDKIKVGETGFAFVVDEESNIVAHPDKTLILSKAAPEILEKTKDRKEGVVYYNGKGRGVIGGFITLDLPLVEKNWKLIVSQSKNEALLLVGMFQRAIIVIFLGGLILILIIGDFLSGSIVKPIKKLTEATKRVAAGELGTKIEVKSGDEIETLASSFNRMTQDLKKSRELLEKERANLEIKVEERTKELEEARSVLEIKVRARTKELKELAENLDEKVKEKTKELQERVKELERFHRLAVGRELKMIEMKKEMQKLKEESGKRKEKYGG